jgi:23S rRNA (guanosine2251-2'-O)-methyltransferase
MFLPVSKGNTCNLVLRYAMRKLQLTELNRKNTEQFQQSPKWPVRIVLDNLRSAHNVGSVFRTADAFLVDKIYLCGITATPPNKEIAKSALGATDSVHWVHCATAAQAIQECVHEGFLPVCVEQTTESQSLENYVPGGPTVLVFGNEVQGVSEEALALCADAIEIPQFGTKHSFNVSVCAGMVLYDFYLKMKPQTS